MKNVNRFPFNIYDPVEIEVDDYIYNCYSAKFKSLYDLYNYLSNDPDINYNIFSTLASESKDGSFAGVPYEEAVEELMLPPRVEYESFLQLSNKLSSDKNYDIKEYIDVKSPAGGVIDIPSYSAGLPLCYKVSRSIYVPKFVKLNIALSYRWYTSKQQVLNRALIITSIISALESAGYMVNVNTFELSSHGNELAYINVNIKNTDETFNKAALYKTLCYVEFLRRILFRVVETLDFQNDWSDGYGKTCDEDFVREALKFDKSDIFIGEPIELDIEGKNIMKDFKNVLHHLSLEDVIDVDKFKNDFEKNVKILKKGIK